MTLRLNGREALIVCVSSFVCGSSVSNAITAAGTSQHVLPSATVAALAALNVLLMIGAAALGESAPAEPLRRPSPRERAVKMVVFYSLIFLVPAVVFLARN